MKLRPKTVGGILITLFLLLTVFYLYSSTIFKKGFALLEDRETRINVNRVRDAINAEVENLESKMKDWSQWDDTYQFIQDGNNAYVKSNLVDSTLFNLTLNLIVYIDLKGKIIYARNVDLETNKVSPIEERILAHIKAHPELLHTAKDEKIKNGFTMIDKTPLIISSQPIMTSESLGPVKGTLLVGRYLNKSRLENISKIIHLNVDLLPFEESGKTYGFREAKAVLGVPDQIYIQPLSEQIIGGFTSFFDREGKPLFIIKMETNREIHQLGKMSVLSFLVSILLVGLCLMGVIVFILNYSVLNRVLGLNQKFKSIRESSDLGLRVPIEGRDELAELGGEINQTLKIIEQNNQAILLLLDNVNQGIFSFDGEGMTGFRCSKAAKDLFGKVPANLHISEVLPGPREKWSEILTALFKEKANFELGVKLLPHEVTLEGRMIELHYSPIWGEKKKLLHVLIMATDVTKLRRLEEERKKVGELNQCLIRILNNKNEFKELVVEIRELRGLTTDKSHFRRSLHTIKGNLSYFGYHELVKVCHHWENELETTDCHLIARDLLDKLEGFLEKHRHILNLNFYEQKNIMVAVDRMQDILEDSVRAKIPSSIMEKFKGLLRVPLADRLGWMDQQLSRNAERKDKKIYPVEWPKTPLIEVFGYEELFRSFIHIAQNIMDHGLEMPEEREKAGKDEAGRIHVDFEMKGDFYHLTFEDDGRGVDLDKIRSLAKSKGIPLSPGASDEEVVDVLFQLGFSTTREISETAGRGVGLSAVRQAAQKLQGGVRILPPAKGDKGMRIHIWFKVADYGRAENLRLMDNLAA